MHTLTTFDKTMNNYSEICICFNFTYACKFMQGYYEPSWFDLSLGFLHKAKTLEKRRPIKTILCIALLENRQGTTTQCLCRANP